MGPLFLGIIVVLILLVIVVGAAAFLWVARRERAGPYECRDFLSPAERSFFGVLQQAIGDEYLIFAKVRVADLLGVRSGISDRQAHLNRIIAKHVDFVLCDVIKVAPVLVIELDDSSHSEQSRQDRDRFLNDAFARTNLPLLRLPARRSYDVALLKSTLADRMASLAAPTSVDTHDDFLVCARNPFVLAEHVAALRVAEALHHLGMPDDLTEEHGPER